MQNNRPCCVECGKPLLKYTHTVFVQKPGGGGRAKEDVYAVIHTKEEAQRHTNLEVVSVRRGIDGTVDRFGTWDGESWGHEGRGFFCNQTCAANHGYRAAITNEHA